MSAIRSVLTLPVSTGGVITILPIDDHDIYVYAPKDTMSSDIINYGYSAPLLLYFPERKLSEEEAAERAEETKLAFIAQENGGSVVFVNPKGEWKDEEEGLYEKVVGKTRISQWNFRNGVYYDDKKPRNIFQKRAMEADPNFDYTPEYFIFGSPVASYVYGKGEGADYLSKYYMKEVKGKSAMGDLGTADITLTAITLEDTKVVPEVTFKDVSIVSVGNNDEVNEALLRSDNRVAVCDKLDVIGQYDQYIGDYKRWTGQIRPNFNFRKEGMVMKPFTMEVKTSPDNREFAMKETHEAGAVLFYGKDLDVHDKNHPVSLVLCFHGGGDTAVATAMIGEWPNVAKANGFILCAVEMHMGVTANETMQMVEKLREEFAIDETRLYATGFSMGGIKSWDFYQEYPEKMAALAPMCATVDVGENTQFSKAARINEDVLVPVFYVGGEGSPLAELPFQEGKCVNRIAYLFKVNKVVKDYPCTKENQDEWEERIYGVKGDETVEVHDSDYPNSITTVRSYKSTDGKVYTKLVSVSNQKHEIRPNTCRMAWDFLKKFRRLPDGSIEVSE